MKVLITGGSRGIGKEIEKIFSSNGYTVFAPTRQELDLSTNIDLKERDFDIVINNAGVNPLASIQDMDQEAVMKVNYYSPLQIIQQCLPHMISKNFGRIVNIGSIWSHISKEKRAAYSASKSALESLARSITTEYGRFGIIANTVSPGFILTDLTKQNNTEEEIALLKNTVPLNKLGEPNQVAELVYFLCNNNNYIAGQNITIDGGYTCVA
jgi:3-oxoacyl-[acyl-carrier protein] reductase